MGNLFPVYLGEKRRFKGLKTKMSQKLMRFCKLWPSLGCVLLTVKYGRLWVSRTIGECQIFFRRLNLFAINSWYIMSLLFTLIANWRIYKSQTIFFEQIITFPTRLYPATMRFVAIKFFSIPSWFNILNSSNSLIN